MTSQVRSSHAIVSLLGIAALVLAAGPLSAQPPGKAAPATKEEKLNAAKAVSADFINLYEGAEVGSGEVDKRRDDFLKKYFDAAGGGIYQIGKNKYLVAVGEVELPFEENPGWTQRRILACNRAELEARAKMVELIETKVESNQLFELFQDYGAPVKENMALLHESQKKGALSAQGYREAIRTFAMGQVIGAVTVKTVEGMNNGMYKVARIMIWSPTLRKLAMNTLLDADYLLPLEQVGKDDLDKIPVKEADLVREVGCKVYYNQKGQRYYVSYGQAEPLARSKDEIPIAMQAARGRAELDAKASLHRALAAEVSSLKLAEMAHVVEIGKKLEKTDELVGNFFQRMESKGKSIKLKGMTVHKTWEYKNPEWKSVVVGCVVVWTPDTRSDIKELELDKRFEISSAETLSQHLVQTYVKGDKLIQKKKPGDNDSKDPKKLP